MQQNSSLEIEWTERCGYTKVIRLLDTNMFEVDLAARESTSDYEYWIQYFKSAVYYNEYHHILKNISNKFTLLACC